MPTTRTVARGEMFDILLSAKSALSELHDDLANLELRWQGIETPDEVSDAPKQMQGKFWTRALTMVVDSRQVAHMMTDEPGGSPASWRTVGQIIIQVFAPRNVVDSYNTGDLLAGAIADIYRNVETPSGVGFEKSAAKEATSEHSFWRWNVTVDFEFYERK
ncbi:hypothetical protein P9A28_gp10 [Sphingomonas phage Eidolon]|uniref:Uncharacterized protein n=1 Tax=Sphingomonas phage Eidolon TaxID=2686311 RepID=A0A6M3T7Y2_9CAUD|nr:hypothetical protein P9A28_gp10 [Sphingomonas phage Eidolon]QJD54396.1 hypothetical protein [Sphingomonas phage Eidolon]